MSGLLKPQSPIEMRYCKNCGKETEHRFYKHRSRPGEYSKSDKKAVREWGQWRCYPEMKESNRRSRERRKQREGAQKKQQNNTSAESNAA